MALSTASGLAHYHHKLPDGRMIVLFVNDETGLVVVDVVDADDKGGTEMLRRNI